MSAYIWARLTASVSPRATTNNWSNFSFFQAASFQGASDLKNKVNARSALGRALTLPKPTGCFIQCVDQYPSAGMRLTSRQAVQTLVFVHGCLLDERGGGMASGELVLEPEIGAYQRQEP